MSLVPTELLLTTNQNQVNQNEPIVVNALLRDQFGNPVQGADVSLQINHPDYGGPILMGTHQTDDYGKAEFEIVLRNLGKSEFSIQSANLTAGPAEVRVFPSLTSSRPMGWNSVLRSMGRFGVDLNTVVGQEIAKGNHPTKSDLCSRLGLNYDLANDRNKLSNALYNMKLTFDYVWRVLYEGSSSYGRDFARLMRDPKGFEDWKNDQSSPYEELRIKYRLRDEDIRNLWVISKMWDAFVEASNQHNIHLFVAYYDANSKSHHYKQPNFWEYVIKQIESGSHWAKALHTILSRHQDLGMILTSGAPVHQVLEGSEITRKMITEQIPPKFRCPVCWENGRLVQVNGTDEYFAHIKQVH